MVTTMITMLSSHIADFFVDNHVIEKEQKDVYRYGAEIILSSIVGILVILLAGICTGSFPESLVFLLCIIPLRQYTGGYHADSYFKCNLYFVLSYLLVLAFYRYLPPFLDLPVLCCGIGFGTAAVWFWSPVDNPNKILTAEQKRKYKKCSFLLLAVVGVISAVLYTFHVRMSVFLSLVLFITAVLMAVEIIKRRLNGYER